MSEKNKPTVLLEHYLKKLKLPSMLREYASMAAVCRDDRSDYPTYLLRLTERELLDRERKASERRVKEARFPVTKTIDTFDFQAQPSINEPLVRELMRGEFIDKRENVLLIGNSGTGKTHLACALAFCAYARTPSAFLHRYRSGHRTPGEQGGKNSPTLPQAIGTPTTAGTRRTGIRTVFQGRFRTAL